MLPPPHEFFAAQTVLPRLRPDLVISRQAYRGKTSFVVKDPIALRYYRLGPQELYLAGLLDGKRTLGDATALMQEKFIGTDLEQSTVMEMLMLFARLSFLQLPGERAQQLFTNLLQQRQAQRLQGLVFHWLGAIIYFKVDLFDPDRLLLRVEKRVRFLWSKWAVALLLLLFVTAIGSVLTHTEQLGSRLPEFLTLHNAFLLVVTMIGVKVVHEFGHALVCKHYGGEVHELGAMFIILAPFLFCNATDAWMFPRKWHKIAVNLAGILVELILASVATLVWVVTQPGLLNQLAFNTMVLCGISTVIFNANPLMKFDGYYVLADLLEIPNLRDRARGQVVGVMRKWFTGVAGPSFDEPSRWRRVLFGVYAVTSYLYLWFVVCRLFGVLGRKLEPYGLASIGRMLMVLSYAGGFVIPLLAVGKQFRLAQLGGGNGIARRRAFQLAGGLAIVVVLLALWPCRQRVVSACVLDGANRVAIHAKTAGFLRTIAVREGQTVRQGEELARLENDEVQQRLANADDQLTIADLSIHQAIVNGDAPMVTRLRTETGELGTVKRRLLEEAAALQLKAPTSGTVLTANLELLRGMYLHEGDLLCEILPQGKISVVIPLTEQDAGLVRSGQPLEFRVYALPGQVFRGTVTRTMMMPTFELPHAALAARFGGDVPTQLDPSGIERPASTLYQAELEIDNTANLLRPGMSGRAKIWCGKTTPLRLVLFHLRALIRLDLHF